MLQKHENDNERTTICRRFIRSLSFLLLTLDLLIFNFLETLFLERIYHATESKERKDSQVH